jgi:hypothetical protein
MLQVLFWDFLQLLDVVKFEASSFSHPTQVFPDTYPWSTSFGATQQ